MDWSDVEYLLRKTYFQGWNFQKPLLNSRNALDLSYDGLLSKTSCDALKANQKLYQLTLDIYKRTENESEKLMIADMLDHYSEEMVLMLAKGLNYPTRPKQINNNLTDKFIENMTESFNNMIDLDSVQKTVDLADNALASLRKSGNNAEHNNNNIISNELISLTQSINNTNINGKGSVECISLLDDSKPNANINNPFMTAKQALAKNNNQKSSVNSTNYSGSSASSASNNSYNPTAQARKILGAKRRFVDPKTETGYRDEGRDINTEFSYYNMNKAPQSVNTSNVNSNSTTIVKKPASTTNTTSNTSASANANSSDEPIDERLAGIEPRLIEMIRNEIMHRVDNITWESIAGLEHAKSSIKEIVVWPMLRPDLFKGLRGPPKGLLLFGPPGTGKTLIGKCIASQAGATFFSISASSLTSKWVGEGEKMVRALFAVARCSQPAVIFIDEIDSLLTQRTDGEFEASRRIKTEFLVQFDGAGTNSEDRILVIGATNRPQEIDEAARRRLLKRLYIPLPEASARATIINNLLANQSHNLTEQDINWICEQTEGYSGSDMDGLCREAAIGPIRSITDILNISTSDVRPISREDFEEALSQVRASVSNQDLDLYLDWNQKFGSLNVKNNGK